MWNSLRGEGMDIFWCHTFHSLHFTPSLTLQSPIYYIPSSQSVFYTQSTVHILYPVCVVCILYPVSVVCILYPVICRHYITEATTTATTTTTPQNNRFNEEKQLPCMCVLNFGTFLCRPVQNNNVKWPNSRICGEREQTTGNFSFSFLTRMTCLPIWFLGSSQFCTSWRGWNNREVAQMKWSYIFK